jgi:hypothetical protein
MCCILQDLFTVTVSSEVYKLLSISLCGFLQLSVTFSLVAPNILSVFGSRSHIQFRFFREWSGLQILCNGAPSSLQRFHRARFLKLRLCL